MEHGRDLLRYQLGLALDGVRVVGELPRGLVLDVLSNRGHEQFWNLRGLILALAERHAETEELFRVKAPDGLNFVTAKRGPLMATDTDLIHWAQQGLAFLDYVDEQLDLAGESEK